MLSEHIDSIFLNNGYCKVPNNQNLDGYIHSLFEPKEAPHREEYFVVIEAITQSAQATEYLLNEGADLLFNKFCSMENLKKSFAKNCTMIICCEAANTTRELTLQLEEDHYNFKKNVIIYTKGEITGLEQFCGSDHSFQKLSNELINNIINSDSGNEFRAFKEQTKNRNNHYSLLIKIIMKLPFISYQPKAKSLIDLEISIEKALTLEQRTIYNKLLLLDLNASEEKTEQLIFEAWNNIS